MTSLIINAYGVNSDHLQICGRINKHKNFLVLDSVGNVYTLQINAIFPTMLLIDLRKLFLFLRLLDEIRKS